MIKGDYYATFDNFEELSNEYPELAADLLSDIGEGEWQDDELYVYYDGLTGLAEYEVCEGWYTSVLGTYGEPDWNGAPNLFDFIDMQALGEALSESWDASMYWTDGTNVVETSYGW
jgi:hypothetical protein